MKISPAQMAQWMAMEAEHSRSKARQRQIVMQHIREHGSRYYPALAKMERNLKKR
jgi:hypothetical protein